MSKKWVTNLSYMKSAGCDIVTGEGGKTRHIVFVLFITLYFLKQVHDNEHMKLISYFHQNFKTFLTDTLANDGTNHINVLNSERLNSGTGPIKVIHGYATPSDTPGKLTVHLETVIFDAPCMYCVSS